MKRLLAIALSASLMMMGLPAYADEVIDTVPDVCVEEEENIGSNDAAFDSFSFDTTDPFDLSYESGVFEEEDASEIDAEVEDSSEDVIENPLQTEYVETGVELAGDDYGDDEYDYDYVDNHLEAYDKETKEGWVSCNALIGSVKTLEIEYTADDTTGITVSWRRYMEDLGVSGTKYTTAPLEDYARYEAVVEDKYGNTATVTYTFTGLEGLAVNYYKNAPTSHGEPVDLTVYAETYGPAPTYEWQYYGSDNKTKHTIPGANKSTYTADPEFATRYVCIIRCDQYEQSVDFYIQYHSGSTCTHDWSGKITKEATCSSGEVITYTCLMCGQTRTSTRWKNRCPLQS